MMRKIVVHILFFSLFIMGFNDVLGQENVVFQERSGEFIPPHLKKEKQPFFLGGHFAVEFWYNNTFFYETSPFFGKYLNEDFAVGLQFKHLKVQSNKRTITSYGTNGFLRYYTDFFNVIGSFEFDIMKNQDVQNNKTNAYWSEHVFVGVGRGDIFQFFMMYDLTPQTQSIYNTLYLLPNVPIFVRLCLQFNL